MSSCLKKLDQQFRILRLQLRQILADLVPGQLRVRVDMSAHSGVLRPVQRAYRDICQPVIFGPQCLPDKP